MFQKFHQPIFAEISEFGKVFFHQASEQNPTVSGHPWEQSTGADPWWILCIGIRGKTPETTHPEPLTMWSILGGNPVLSLKLT